ncbi:Rho Guanine Nucleotide Exchange Factor 40 [Manis pentadactyla]|nr:Rho Guanine Nucleotide Exchange Factor 40 [Manis pentadactyla]
MARGACWASAAGRFRPCMLLPLRPRNRYQLTRPAAANRRSPPRVAAPNRRHRQPWTLPCPPTASAANALPSPLAVHLSTAASEVRLGGPPRAQTPAPPTLQTPRPTMEHSPSTLPPTADPAPRRPPLPLPPLTAHLQTHLTAQLEGNTAGTRKRTPEPSSTHAAPQIRKHLERRRRSAQLQNYKKSKRWGLEEAKNQTEWSHCDPEGIVKSYWKEFHYSGFWNLVSLDTYIQNTVSALYPPFEATAATVLWQLFGVAKRLHGGHGLRCLTAFLVLAGWALQRLQQEACLRLTAFGEVQLAQVRSPQHDIKWQQVQQLRALENGLCSRQGAASSVWMYCDCHLSHVQHTHIWELDVELAP